MRVLGFVAGFLWCANSACTVLSSTAGIESDCTLLLRNVAVARDCLIVLEYLIIGNSAR